MSLSANGVVLFGYGNPSRGDDALGPLLLGRAETWVAAHPGVDVDLISDFQLQIEHAEDLCGRSLALFLDADVSCPPPFRFRRALPKQDESFTTHELSPEAVLHTFRSITGQKPPPSFILSVRGERFELGEPLSPGAASHVEAAWKLLQELMADPRSESWSMRLT